MHLLETKHRCRSNFNEYLRKALGYINHAEQMSLLDIGCGTGVSVLEIAKHTNWQITAVEPNKDSLFFLNNRIQELKYIDRITTIHCSIEEVLLPEKSFDIILAEGLFNIIGFDKGIDISSKYLTSNGFIIIHDEVKDREIKLQIFQNSGFNLITSFVLDEKIWWDKYCGCIEKQIKKLDKSKLKGLNSQKYFNHITSEIKMYKENPSDFRSVYYVIQKVKV